MEKKYTPIELSFAFHISRIHEFNIPHSFLFLKIVDHPAEVGAFHFGVEGRGVLASGKPQKREGTELLIQVFPGFLNDSNMGFRR